MPPMTFEPLINMAGGCRDPASKMRVAVATDAVRQPRTKFAHTAAWLGAITADIPHQVSRST